MYEFLTGPMLWAAFLIFVIGLARRVVLYIRGLDWRLERVAYGPGRKIGMKGAISSVLQWLVPFGTHSWRRQRSMCMKAQTVRQMGSSACRAISSLACS